MKRQFPAWVGYGITWAALMGLSVLPTIFFGGWNFLLKESGPYLLYYFLYWGVVSALILLFISKQKQAAFDAPLRDLSQAAKKVAGGDFSVYLQPRHAADRYDYIDVMFQDFNKMVQDLGSLETMKSDFIASVSHEIKTPLANIQGYAMALDTKKLTKNERAEYTKTILESSEKLNRLVANILKLNRLENQSVELNIESYDLCAQLSECILSFEEKISNKKLKIEVEMDDRATIDADKSMVEIVLNNLLSNAIKFSEVGRKIIVKQTSTDKDVVVNVQDFGPGMDAETMSKIFDKFYQADESRSNEGNGLGLSLVGKIVDLVDGEIWVESEVGKGSTFIVKLKHFVNIL